MAKIESWFDCDLKRPVQVQVLSGNVFSLDNNGSRIGVKFYDNGQKTTVTGSVSGRFILANGQTIDAITGTLATVNGQSVAYIDVPQSVLHVPGPLKITIQLTDSSVVTTVAAILATVYQTKTDDEIVPSQQVIDDWNAAITQAIGTQNLAIANQDAKIDDLKSAIDYYGHPAIKEIYIYDTTYDVAGLNQTDTTRIMFMNAAKNAITARATVDRNNPIVPIAEAVTGSKNQIGWCLVDWNIYSNKIINLDLPATVHILDFSPSIKLYIGDFEDKIAEIKKIYFAEDCPFIKELYVNAAGVSAHVDKINDIDHNSTSGLYRVNFANDGLTSITARAVFSSSDLSAIVPIKSGNNVYGYIIVDWSGDYFSGTHTGIGKNILDKAYELNYSPTIQLNVFYNEFAEDCPWIKELYINSAGVEADVATVHMLDVVSQHKISFSNTAMNAFTGYATFNHSSPESMAPIVMNSTVLGYVVVDWNKAPSVNITVMKPINAIAKDINFSPSIKVNLQDNAALSQLSQRVSVLESGVSILNAETTTLESNLTAEESARSAADTALGARIDNLVAPSGQSVAEITDARVGANGTTYASLEARLNAEYGMLNSRLNKIRTVGVGQQYQTIQSAVNASSDGDVILVFPGTYYEKVTFPSKSLCLIGINRGDVILQYDNNDYNDPPLEMCQGVLMNMTIRAFNNGGTLNPTYGKAYAMHCDFQSWGIVGGTLYCENVKFVNENYRAVGMGLRGEAHYEFVNCEFNCLSGYEALYFHDANDLTHGGEALDISNQSCSFKNCTFINNSSTKPTISANTQERQIAVASIEWQRNIVVNKSTGGLITMSFYDGRNIGGGHWMDSSDWVLRETSAMNTVSAMNYTGN